MELKVRGGAALVVGARRSMVAFGVVLGFCVVTLLGAPVHAGPDPNLARWVQSLRQDPSFKVRVQAAVLLGRSASPAALNPLLQGLGDEHVAVRGAVCLALSRLQLPGAVQPLLRVAATDDASEVREEARRALNGFPHAAALPAVLTTAASSDVEVRKEAIALLAEWPEDDARQRLVEALADVPPIRQLARDMLSKQPEALRTELLRQGLASSNNSVRMAASVILGEVATARAVALLMDAYEQEVESAEVRRSLREQLRNLRALMPRQQLMVEARTPGDRFKRARALKFLGVVGGDESYDLLIENLSSDDVYLRGVAALALAEAGDARAIQPLLRLMDDDSNARIVQIVRNSVQILQRRDNPLRD